MSYSVVKFFLISNVVFASLTFGETVFNKETSILAQTNDLEELKQLDEQKRKQQQDLNKKLDIFKNLDKSETQNKLESASINEENQSNWLVTLGLISGGGVATLGGLLLFRFLTVEFLLSKDYKRKLNALPAHEQPWWNRPLFGENSIFTFLSRGNKLLIPEDALNLHQTHLENVKNLGAIAKSQDSQKFNSQDFIFFLKIRSYFVKNIGNYQGLKPSADLLDVAIKTKNSFLMIDQTELRYRGGKQQDFYEAIIDLLGQNLDKEEFNNRVQSALQDALPEVKTPQGKQALQSYREHLENLAEHELGLKLLGLFKAYNLADFSILNRVSALMDSLEKATLTDTKSLVIPIMKDYEIFEKLAPIIELPENRVNPQTFALIIQYIALQNRHQDSYREYAQLTYTLKDWKKAYDAVKLVREQYSPEEYKLPSEFQEELIAEEIFNKYKNYLD